MSNLSSPRTLAALTAALAAGAVAATPALADQQGIDPAIYETGIPAGQIEHGKVDELITGGSVPRHTLTEYWASDDRWRSVTRDVRTGRVVREAFSTPREFVYFNAGRSPRVIRGKGPDMPPMAGWTAAYNRKLVENGKLRETGSRTVAGIDGVVYASKDWVTDDPDNQTEIVLERGTFKPLSRITDLPASQGTSGFRHAEVLVSREVVAETSQTAAPLSAAAKKRVLASWNAKVRKARNARKGR